MARRSTSGSGVARSASTGIVSLSQRVTRSLLEQGSRRWASEAVADRTGDLHPDPPPWPEACPEHSRRVATEEGTLGCGSNPVPSPVNIPNAGGLGRGPLLRSGNSIQQYFEAVTHVIADRKPKNVAFQRALLPVAGSGGRRGNRAVGELTDREDHCPPAATVRKVSA